jgi:polyisoprenoid-binding protein YceI
MAGLVTAAANVASAQTTAPDAVTYRILPSSRFDVETGTAGLLGFAGHKHVIRAREFAGAVVYRPGNPSASRLEMTIPTNSLEVLTPNDPGEIQQVTETMRTEVLHVSDYPEIRFLVTGATPTRTGARLDGQLTMAGHTRPVQVDAVVQVGADTLRARGTFAVNQTDFGIQPYRGGPGGSVRVADKVSFDFDAVAVRQPAAAKP